MSGHIDREVYIHRRQSSQPSHPPVQFSEPYYGYEVERGRSVSSRGSSSRRPSAYEEDQIVSYQSRPRSHTRSRSHSVSSRNRNHSIPCSEDCVDNPRRRSSSRPPRRIEDELDYSTEEEERKLKKHRNKQLLYTGLAGITTIAASNNIYQSKKAHKARRQAVEEGRMCSAEAKRMRNKAILMDVFSVGVAAIGVNNAVNGWKKMGAVREENQQAQIRFHERQELRRQIAY